MVKVKYGTVHGNIKRTGQRCKRFCSEGKTVCKWHGGASSGAPKCNKIHLDMEHMKKLLVKPCLMMKYNMLIPWI